jgi:hypothetical protein
MFDRVGSLAERVATNVSRRAFLGRMGQGALAVAGGMAALLAFPQVVRASQKVCTYRCTNVGVKPAHTWIATQTVGCNKPCPRILGNPMMAACFLTSATGC